MPHTKGISEPGRGSARQGQLHEPLLVALQPYTANAALWVAEPRPGQPATGPTALRGNKLDRH